MWSTINCQWVLGTFCSFELTSQTVNNGHCLYVGNISNGHWSMNFGLFLLRTLTLESEFMGLSPKARMVEPFFQMMMKSSSTSTCHIDNLFVTFKPKPWQITKIDGWVLRVQPLMARLNIWQSNLIDGFPTRMKILNGQKDVDNKPGKAAWWCPPHWRWSFLTSRQT